MTALAKIHIAKKEMALHDDDYRAILQRVTGQTSAKGLSDRQAGALLEEFKRLGWKPSVIKGGKASAPTAKAKPADSPVAKKARALWISLWQLGAIRDSSEKALEVFAKRQLKCDHLVWADQQQIYKLIEALKAMAERHGWSQDLNGIPEERQVITVMRRLLDAQCKKLNRASPVGLYDMSLKDLTEKAMVLGIRIRASVEAK